MRFLAGASGSLVPFSALRLAEARSDRGPSIVALETEICWISPAAGLPAIALDATAGARACAPWPQTSWPCGNGLTLPGAPPRSASP